MSRTAPIESTPSTVPPHTYDVAAVIYDAQLDEIDAPNQAKVLKLRHGNSEVLGVVSVCELFLTFRQRGLFWQVRTLDGVEGFMDVAQIRMLSNGEHLARQLGTHPAT
ncbi:MAG: hypothetical protein ACRER5_02960 [Pseudomonas sp.]